MAMQPPSAVEILTPEDLGQGRQLIRARGPLAQWTMERTGDEEPLFPSIPLTQVLGFGRPDYMNRLITRLYPTAIEYSVTVTGNSVSDGEVFYRLLYSGGRGRPIKDYLLTRRQVLKVIMRSDTRRADALQDEMISILLAVQRGDLVLLRPAERTTPAWESALRIALESTFEGQPLTTLFYEGRPCWYAAQLGRILGYGRGPAAVRYLQKLLRQGELIEDGDFVLAGGQYLVFESGLYILAQRIGTSAGVRLRHWLPQEVWPRLRSAADGSPPPPALVLPEPRPSRTAHVPKGRLDKTFFRQWVG